MDSGGVESGRPRLPAGAAPEQMPGSEEQRHVKGHPPVV